MIAELHAVNKIHFKTEELQREDCTFVAHITMDHMRLDAEHAWALRLGICHFSNPRAIFPAC